MAASAKYTPWLNLAAGLLWLLSVARDLWMPGFLSISGRHFGSDVWLSLTIAALWLFNACRGFMRMRAPSAR